jgi:hypothetical protein
MSKVYSLNSLKSAVLVLMSVRREREDCVAFVFSLTLYETLVIEPDGSTTRVIL